MSHTIQRGTPPPLPATIVDLEKGRRVKIDINLNDEVDRIHVKLWGDDDKGELYRKLNWATWSSGSVHGSLACDDTVVAQMLQAAALEEGNDLVANTNLATLIKSWKVVTRRLGQSREQRRNMVDGEVVPEGNNSSVE